MVSSACLEMKPTWLSCFWVLQNSAPKVCFFCPDVHWRFDSLALSMIFHLKKWMHQIQYIKIWFGVLQWHPAHCFLLGLHLPASKSTEKVVHVIPLRILFVGLPDACQKMLRFQKNGEGIPWGDLTSKRKFTFNLQLVCGGNNTYYDCGSCSISKRQIFTLDFQSAPVRENRTNRTSPGLCLETGSSCYTFAQAPKSPWDVSAEESPCAVLICI